LVQQDWHLLFQDRTISLQVFMVIKADLKIENETIFLTIFLQSRQPSGYRASLQSKSFWMARFLQRSFEKHFIFLPNSEPTSSQLSCKKRQNLFEHLHKQHLDRPKLLRVQHYRPSGSSLQVRVWVFFPGIFLIVNLTPAHFTAILIARSSLAKFWATAHKVPNPSSTSFHRLAEPAPLAYDFISKQCTDPQSLF
jgi:hypothetical protein